jgi:hypothetical protein
MTEVTAGATGNGTELADAFHAKRIERRRSPPTHIEISRVFLYVAGVAHATPHAAASIRPQKTG